MKKMLFLFVASFSFLFATHTARAQADSISYIVVYRDSTVLKNGLIGLSQTPKIAGFKTQTTLSAFLNEEIDSTALISIYDVRTKKPLKATFSSVEVEKVIKQRERQKNWSVK